MKTIIEPYLFFGGRCEEALEHYERIFGSKRVMLMRFGESPERPPEGMLAPGWENKVMHASFRIGDCMIMVSDGCGTGDDKFAGFRLSICPDNEGEAKRIFDLLAEGGSIEMPLGKTFWSPCYGMCTDRFGVGWMMNVTGEMAA